MNKAPLLQGLLLATLLSPVLSVSAFAQSPDKVCSTHYDVINSDIIKVTKHLQCLIRDVFDHKANISSPSYYDRILLRLDVKIADKDGCHNADDIQDKVDSWLANARNELDDPDRVGNSFDNPPVVK
jgi:hypothetical protein